MLVQVPINKKQRIPTFDHLNFCSIDFYVRSKRNFNSLSVYFIINSNLFITYCIENITYLEIWLKYHAAYRLTDIGLLFQL